SHVEDRADSGAPSPNRSPTPFRATVVVERRDADERGDLFAIHVAELGKQSHERYGNNAANSFDRFEQTVLRATRRVRVDELRDSVVGLVDLLREKLDEPVDVR